MDRASERRYMRDKARQDRAMRDGRNPYGSAGGYVTRNRPRRSDRAMEDMAKGYDMAMQDMAERDRQRQKDMAKGYDMAMEDMARGRGGRGRGRDRNFSDFDDEDNADIDMGYMPFNIHGGMDYNSGWRKNSFGRYLGDYADYDNAEKLDDEDLKEWHEKLLKEIPEQYKHLYKKDNIEQVANQMQIEFEKFKPLELTVTATMIATDYPKSVGYADVNRAVAMAKEWLADEDSKLKYGKKLSAYYDNVVNG